MHILMHQLPEGLAWKANGHPAETLPETPLRSPKEDKSPKTKGPAPLTEHTHTLSRGSFSPKETGNQGSSGQWQFVPGSALNLPHGPPCSLTCSCCFYAKLFLASCPQLS